MDHSVCCTFIAVRVLSLSRWRGETKDVVAINLIVRSRVDKAILNLIIYEAIRALVSYRDPPLGGQESSTFCFYTKIKSILYRN